MEFVRKQASSAPHLQEVLADQVCIPLLLCFAKQSAARSRESGQIHCVAPSDLTHKQDTISAVSSQFC